MTFEREGETRLVLGTVQLGMDYGVGNVRGKPDQTAANAIVGAAWAGGVREFDTAQGYGDSEAVLGRALQALDVSAQARIISKPQPARGVDAPGKLIDEVRSSLERLGAPRLHGLMWHRESVLDQDPAAARKAADAVRESGLAGKLGVSVYTPQKALAALDTDWVGMVQVPGNVFDRRFEALGVFDRADELGKTVYVRSVFLQGLLLMEPGRAERAVPGAGTPVEELGRLAREAGMSNVAFCIGFVRESWPRAKVLFGAEASEQVEEILACWRGPFPSDGCGAVQRRLRVDQGIVDPSQWHRRAK